MAPFVTLLALAMPFMTIQVMFPPVCNALGRPGLNTLISAVGAIMMPTAFLIGIQFGAIGLAWVWLLVYPLFTVATIFIAGKPLGLRLTDVAIAALPGIGCAAAMAALVLAAGYWIPENMAAPFRLVLLVMAGAASFGAILLIFARDSVDQLIGLVIRRQSPAAPAGTAPPVQAP